MSTTIQVKERPILFSTPMVQGILSRIKRMTRRTKRLDDINKSPEEWKFSGMRDSYGRYLAMFRPSRSFNDCYHINPKAFNMVTSGTGVAISCPYGKPGDLLWVRETWCQDLFGRDVYKATDGETDGVGRKFRFHPSIHMPRTASRILLEITDIRVERLQDITEEDAITEGVESLQLGTNECYKHYSAHLHYSKEELKEGCPFSGNARKSFFTLWESINGRESLLQNPWVWVITFKVLEVKK